MGNQEKTPGNGSGLVSAQVKTYPTEAAAFARQARLRRDGINAGVIRLGAAWGLTHDPDTDRPVLAREDS